MGGPSPRTASLVIKTFKGSFRVFHFCCRRNERARDEQHQRVLSILCGAGKACAHKVHVGQALRVITSFLRCCQLQQTLESPRLMPRSLRPPNLEASPCMWGSWACAPHTACSTAGGRCVHRRTPPTAGGQQQANMPRCEEVCNLWADADRGLMVVEGCACCQPEHHVHTLDDAQGHHAAPPVPSYPQMHCSLFQRLLPDDLRTKRASR